MKITAFKTRYLIHIFFINAGIFFSTNVSAETGKLPDPDGVVIGKALYQQYCKVCHKKNGTGKKEAPWSIRAPGHVSAMPLNETSHAWHHSDEQLM